MRLYLMNPDNPIVSLNKGSLKPPESLSGVEGAGPSRRGRIDSAGGCFDSAGTDQADILVVAGGESELPTTRGRWEIASSVMSKHTGAVNIDKVAVKFEVFIPFPQFLDL